MPRLSATGKAALDELVAQTAAEGRLPGFVLAVTSVDEELYAAGAGNHIHGDSASPKTTTDTVFWICSMTKLLTAIAALQLIEQGRLTFDTHASKYFPELENPVVLKDPFDPDSTSTPAQTPITVFHLITHSSGSFYAGLTHVLPEPLTHEYKSAAEKHADFFQQLKGKYPGVPLAFEPGAAFAYGYSTDVLGFIVEKVSGLTLEEYFQANIFEPIGVKSVSFHLTAESKEQLMNLHLRNPDGSVVPYNHGPVTPRYPAPVHNYLGGVGAFATLPDYATILRHLLQIEAGRDVPNAVLKRETVKSLFEPKLGPAGAGALTMLMQMLDAESAALGVNWGNGIAINLQDWPGMRKANSGWWSGWAGTWFVLDPTSGVAVVFGSQVVPPMDPVTLEIFQKAEQIVYANLEEVPLPVLL